MRIFVAGASGAIGRQLVPMLVERGYEVTGTTRGVEPGCDRGDGRAGRAHGRARSRVRGGRGRWRRARGDRPPAHRAGRRPRSAQLREDVRGDEPAAHARAPITCSRRRGRSGARRFVAQSFAGWPYAKTGDWVKAEDEPLDPDPPEAARTALEAVASSRGGRGRRRSGNRGHRAPLRRLLRAQHLDGDRPRRRADRRWSASGVCRSSATARRGGRWSTSPTPRRRRWPRSSTARPASTTSSTTSRLRSARCCRCWPRRSAPSRRGGSPSGSAGWSRGSPPARAPPT